MNSNPYKPRKCNASGTNNQMKWRAFHLYKQGLLNFEPTTDDLTEINNQIKNLEKQYSDLPKENVTQLLKAFTDTKDKLANIKKQNEDLALQINKYQEEINKIKDENNISRSELTILKQTQESLVTNGVVQECRICLATLIVGDVYTCINEHAMCRDCLDKYQEWQCPYCKVSAEFEVHPVLSRISRMHRYVCPTEGCNKILDADEYMNHTRCCVK